nr:hypothetical protein [Burkholderiales bacterium]
MNFPSQSSGSTSIRTSLRGLFSLPRTTTTATDGPFAAGSNTPTHPTEFVIGCLLCINLKSTLHDKITDRQLLAVIQKFHPNFDQAQFNKYISNPKHIDNMFSQMGLNDEAPEFRNIINSIFLQTQEPVELTDYKLLTQIVIVLNIFQKNGIPVPAELLKNITITGINPRNLLSDIPNRQESDNIVETQMINPLTFDHILLPETSPENKEFNFFGATIENCTIFNYSNQKQSGPHIKIKNVTLKNVFSIFERRVGDNVLKYCNLLLNCLEHNRDAKFSFSDSQVDLQTLYNDLSPDTKPFLIKNLTIVYTNEELEEANKPNLPLGYEALKIININETIKYIYVVKSTPSIGHPISESVVGSIKTNTNIEYDTVFKLVSKTGKKSLTTTTTVSQSTNSIGNSQQQSSSMQSTGTPTLTQSNSRFTPPPSPINTSSTAAQPYSTQTRTT